jgi:hypothetical protein
LWFWRTFTSLEAMYGAIRSIEASRLARIEASEWFQIQERQFYIEPYRALRNDPWLVKPRPSPAYIDPGADLPSVSELATSPLMRAASRIGAQQRSVGADLESGRGGAFEATSVLDADNVQGFDGAGEAADVGADMDAVSPETCQSMLLYTRSLQAAREYFGEPDPTVTLEQAHQFEQRFGPLIQSLHFSHSWLRKFLGEHTHQRTADRDRRPVEAPHWTGSAVHRAHEQEASAAARQQERRPLLEPDMHDLDL